MKCYLQLVRLTVFNISSIVTWRWEGDENKMYKSFHLAQSSSYVFVVRVRSLDNNWVGLSISEIKFNFSIIYEL